MEARKWQFLGGRISLGCPLSPLMGVQYLALLDRRMAQNGFFLSASWPTG